jgi:hypothetical protein
MKWILLSVALGSLGCQTGLTDEAPFSSNLDEAYFRCRVQPIITKSCAALACHGDIQRYYHVFGRNRLRLSGGEEQRNAALSAQERGFNYNATRAIVNVAKPKESYLLLKPLESSEGGYYHGGATRYKKGNVYINRDDPDFKTLEKWVNGEKEDPACIEPGSDS